jgi:hypothetical protein
VASSPTIQTSVRNGLPSSFPLEFREVRDWRRRDEDLRV